MTAIPDSEERASDHEYVAYTHGDNPLEEKLIDLHIGYWEIVTYSDREDRHEETPDRGGGDRDDSI
ncbi:hypothetical protein [Natrinema gelatinilyticum]|uniref:hypothetical protein n=1 Tax=Natrinema gelatinilyticum TaxID=2961571 RepID=UPI0020C352EE|nr:hypothetical protein [Natrinema gelatinilyticum]